MATTSCATLSLKSWHSDHQTFLPSRFLLLPGRTKEPFSELLEVLRGSEKPTDLEIKAPVLTGLWSLGGTGLG